jgi:hypothetical protein
VVTSDKSGNQSTHTTKSPRTNRRRSPGVSFPEVSRLGRALPGVVESTSYGTPALKVDGKLLARLKEDGETLVLRMDFVNRDLLLRAEPDLFFLTDHYLNYPSILLRLTRVTSKRLAELLEDAWRLVAPRRIHGASEGTRSRTKRPPR